MQRSYRFRCFIQIVFSIQYCIDTSDIYILSCFLNLQANKIKDKPKIRLTLTNTVFPFLYKTANNALATLDNSKIRDGGDTSAILIAQASSFWRTFSRTDRLVCQ